ncbi:MAG: hypothetical protein AAB510_01080 [Patescibacteria group bacterium]
MAVTTGVPVFDLGILFGEAITEEEWLGIFCWGAKPFILKQTPAAPASRRKTTKAPIKEAPSPPREKFFILPPFILEILTERYQ